ncbi:trimeric autotransporter adhesin [Haemophilus parahaemolyticus]|uniref:Trimeric autotransporter adhesin n=1 Tax=Haemophilus parahaemolyticus TaxID=735 RepID=A0A377HZY6_HAEPH|nr:ESPR-type extended signal peptide-containing protein [Haemophilus parahaemolyticus]STO63765.1 trimeric autotransporter adhesin [Haemophilus parahaemolyticus]
MMNKIYKVIWNAALQCWVAVSELGKAKGKTKSKKVLSAAAVLVASAIGISSNAEAAVDYSTGGTFGGGMAIGSSSYANTNAIAYGHEANARALEDVAIGYKTIAGAAISGSTSHTSEQASVAVGTNAQAQNVATVAIGAHAKANVNFGTAVGAGATAAGENGSAFGQGAMATGVYATALGKGALAKQDYSIALGKEAAANTQLTTSIGSKTNATGFSAIAIGSGHVPATGNTVIENIQGAQATADDSMAVGASALANKVGATALGKLSKATNNNAVAVGPDSVASGSWATATGASANASGEASAAFGESATASGKKSIATGSHASASGENAIASGKNAKALASNTIAIGADANATANAAGSLVIGRGAVVNATDATVVGPVAQANGANATAVGRGAAANGTESTALGRGAVANGNQSTALGKGSQAKVDSGVALGDGAVADRVARKGSEIVINNSKPSASTGFNDQDAATSNSVYAPVRLVDAPGALQLIKNTVKGNKGAVSVGDSGNTRQIINVAPGSADSDAVNVAQLKAVAGGIKKYSVTSPDGSITITNPATGDDPQNFKIKMNTTAVQDAAAWNIKSGSESGNGEQVRGGQTVTFAGSDTINVVRNGKTLTFNANISSISNGRGANEGKLQTTDNDNKYLAKTKNVVDAINNSGWTLQANGNKVGLVNPGDKVNIKAGTGVTITPTNENGGVSTLTISAAQQNYSWKLKEDSQTAAQALNVTNNTAVSLKGENFLNITNKGGGNFAFKTVTADVAYTAATGAVNAVSSATGLVTNKNLSDVIRNSGFQLKENGTLKNVVNPGESLNFKPGKGTTVTVSANGDVQVNANVADIRAGNNVTVDKGNNGVVTINAKDTNTQASVANGTGLTLTESNNSNGTKKYTLGVNVDNNTIKVENGKLVANLSNVVDTNTQSTVEAKANNFVTVDGSTKNTNGTTKYQVGVTTGDVAVTEATGAVTAISAATGVATNKTVADAIAKSGFQLQENGTLRNVVNPGEILNFKPGKGTTVTVGENGDVQVNANVAGITAGKNISTTTDANGNVTINAKDTSAHVKAANNAAVKVDKAATTRTENNADITDYTVDLTDQTKTNITHGVNANETVTNKGLTFNGNTGSTGIKKLGSEVDVKGNTSNNVITTTANTNGITVDYNGTAAAQVTNLTYKANNANAKSVTLAKGLDFTNGTQTTAEVGDNGVVKFNVNTTALSSATANGNIQVPTGANSDGLVSAKNVANAINTSGWNLQANNASVGLINPSDKVSFDAGNGVTVTSTNEANGVSHIKVAAKVDGSTITVNDRGQLVANLSGVVNTQASVSNATSSPITIATTQNTNGTNNYAVDVNVDGKTITKEGGVLKAVIPAVEKVDLTVNKTGDNAGKVEAPKDADKGKLVTAENVAKAINESYWVAKRGDSVTTNEDSGDGDSNIAAGNNVTFIAGKNIALQKDGNKFIYATKDDVTFNNVTANNTTTTNLTVKNGGNVDMGGNQVHNVSTGTAPTDAVNVKQLYDTVSGNVSTESVIKKADEDNIAEVSPKAGQTVGGKNATYEVSVSKAKIKALANETVKVNTSTAANNPITVTPHTENGNTTYTVNFDGTKAASEIPLTYKANDGAGKTVKLSEGLNFKNGTQTTAEVGDNGVVKFNVNTTTLSNTTANGKITVPDGNGLVTAKEVANAINAASWSLNVSGTTVQNVKAGDFVNFTNGNGTTVTYKDGAVRVNANVSGLTAGNNITIEDKNKDGNFTISATDTNTQASVEAKADNFVTVDSTAKNPNGTTRYQIGTTTAGVTVNTDTGAVTVPGTASGLTTDKAVAEAISKSGFQLKQRGEATAKSVINPGEVLNFNNGTATIATVDANGNVKYDVNVDGKTITLNNDGKLVANVPDTSKVSLTNNAGKVGDVSAEDANKLVTGDNLAKTINATYWKASQGAHEETSEETTGVASSEIKPGDELTFVSGKNMALKKEGNKFVYATKDDVVFNNVTANNTTTKNFTVNKGGNVDMGGNQVHNVSTGTAPTDAVNVKQLYDTVASNVSTESVVAKNDVDNIATVAPKTGAVGDKNAQYEVSVSKAKIKDLVNETVKVNTSTVVNNPISVTPHTENGNTTYSVNFNGENASKVIPLSYKANDGEAKTVKLSEGLNFKNGTQTTAEVGDNGVVKFNVNTTALSSTATDGKITVPTGDGLVTAKEVANAINAASWSLNVSGATVQTVKAGDFVNFVNGDGTTVTYKDGSVRVNANVTSVVSGNNNATITRDPNTGIVTVNAKDTNTQASVKNGSGITVTSSTNANGTANYTVAVNVDGSTITVNNDGKLVANVPDTSKVSLTNNAGKVGDVSTADANKFVTGDNLAKTINATYWKASQGAHEETSEETTGVASSEIKPGDELTFVSGKNMALKKEGNKFVYATKDDVVFNNVTANNTTTKNLTVKNGGNVDMGGNQVHNVSTGTAPTDAVNVQQLYDTVSGNVSTESVIKKADEDNIAEVSPKAGQTVGGKNATYEVSVSKAKIKALANETVKVNTSTAANNPITVTPHTENGNTTYTVNFDGTKAASEIPLTYKANDGAGKTVKLSEGLNFKNGTQTTAEVGDNGVVKFNVNTTTLSNTTANGKITVPDGNGLVTAKEVANAINAASWSLNVSGTTVQNVKAGDFVNFTNGNGTTVTYKDGAVRVNANVTSVVSGNNNATITRDPNTGIVTVNAKDTNTQASVKNGSGITVTSSTNANGTANYTVAVNVDGSTITVNNDGKLVANVPDTSKVSLTNNAGKVGDVSTADANKFVTGDNLAKTINATYWKASQGAHEETSEETTGVASSEIKPGDELTFVSGKNMALKKEGNKFVYATKDDVVFNNVTANNTTTKNFTVNKGGNVDMGGNQVHNVSTGTAPTDAVNVKQLYDTVASNVSTESVVAKNDVDNIATVAPKTGAVGDKNAQYEVSVSKAKIKDLVNETVKVNTSTVVNNPISVTPHTENGNTTYSVNFNGENASKVIPLSYKANDGEAKTVKLSEGLNFKNGTQTTAEVGDNGVVKFNVNTTALSSTATDGKITVPTGDGLVTAKEVANAINAASWSLNVSGATVQTVKAGDFVNFVNGDGTTVTYKDGSVRVNANVTSVVSGNNNATITRDPNTGIVTVNAKDTNTQASVKNGSGITVTSSTNANGTANYTVAVNVDGSTITVNNDGKLVANVPDTSKVSLTNNAGKVGDVSTADANKFVTGDNLAKTINATYWKASQGAHEETSEETTGVASSEIKPGDELTFVSGKNMALKKEGNKFVYATKDDVVFNNVTANNTTTKNLTVKNGGNVDMGGNQVHNVANGTKGTDAVNLDQLNATTAIANAGWVIKANGTNATTVKPNATVSLNNTDGNILITKNTANNNVTFNFNPNATFGVKGKDGVDGSIGVNGKDGASVVINGKDGSIGLTGPKGADGKDGVSLTLKPEKGTTTVNEKDANKEIERIKYTANGTTREVATLDDGLKFAGDDNAVINRTLGSLLNITGGADETTLTDNNIGVVYDKAIDGLKVKLAKDVNLTSNGSVTIGNTTLNNNGFTITNKEDPSKTVSVTDKGLNNGGNTITNVAPGVNGTDAVNLDQLNATTAIANAGWVIKANGTNATTVKPNATVSLNNTDGNILITKNTANNNVTFNFNPNATFGVKGKDGVDGSIGVNGKDGSSVVINGKDGSIGLNGKDGKNGLSIKGDQGPAGVDGKDGETKNRIVYEYADPQDPNKTIRENVATLNDGLRFTGNNGVENAHRLNTLVTIIGEGVDKAASASFTSASGNINVKADGKGTLEVQLAKNLKNIETINNGKSTITLNKDGGTTISGGDVSVAGNKVTNVKDGDVSADSKEAVNGSQLYHVMTNATAGWNLSVNNGKDKGNVKPGAQVDLNNTDGNIIISKNANNVTFNFNPNATFGVKGKDGKKGVDGSISVNGENGSSVVLNGKDGSIGLTGPKGAASANMSVQKGTTTVNTDRDGGKDVTRIVYTDKDKDGKDIKREVATLDDGLKFKGDSGQVINRTLGSQMNITGGADSTKLTDNNIGVVYDKDTNGLKVKLSKDVNLSKDGSITIGGTQVTNNGLTIKGGPSVTVNGVDAGNKKVTNVADGDINATSKDAVNGSQLYQAVNNINKNVNAAKTELEEGDNVTITSRVGNNGQTIYKVSSTDNSAHVQGGSDAVSVTKAETTRKDGLTTVTDYTVDLSSKTKDDIKKGVDAHDTVTNKGLTFNADKGTTTGVKKLGSQVAVNGDNKNIETVADTNGVKVKLKDDINVNSVTANTFKAGNTIVNTKGVQVAAKDDHGNNTNVVINEKGISAGNTRIQNVAAGRADTDAVNVSQLKGAVTNISNQMNKMDKNLRAGVAGAMAAGGLYHATLPGKSMVAAGAGTYKGESALAVGYSRLSDNGKVGIKFSVNTNTRGDSGAAASVGYQW